MHCFLDQHFKTIIPTLALFAFLFFQKTANAQIIGPAEVCPGSVHTYYVPSDPCLGFVEWLNIFPFGSILSQTDTSVVIQWSAPGVSEVCTWIENFCTLQPEEFCLVVTSAPIPPTVVEAEICQGDCVEIAGQVFCAPTAGTPITLTSWQGCDSVVMAIVNVIPPITTVLGNVQLPCNGIFEICGETFNTPGVHQVTCTSWQGCDSTVYFNLIYIVVDISLPETLTCAQTEVTLDGSASSSGPEFTYSWTTIDGNITSDPALPQVTVNAPGTYCLMVTNTISGCFSTNCVVVEEDTVVPTFSIAAGILPCNGGTTMLSANPQGPNYTYLWTGPGIVNGANTLNPIVDETGIYCLVMTDVTNGCMAEQCVEVTDKIPFDVTGPGVVCNPGNYSYIASAVGASASPFQLHYSINGVPQTSVFFSSNPYTFDLLVPGSTVFQFTLTDQNGCSSETVTIETQIDEFDIDFTVTQVGCNPAKLLATVSGPFQNTVNSYAWNTGSSDPSIFVTQNGWYWLAVEDNYGCTFYDSLYLTLDYESFCAFMEGDVFWDNFDNCTSDPGEVALSGWLVQAAGTNGTFFGTSDGNGHYFIPVDPGDYTLSIFPPSPLWEPCENDILVSLPNAGESATVDFLNTPLPGCPELMVDISTPLLRRCFSNNYYYVNYCNEGAGTATDVYIEIDLDSYLTPVNSSLPFTDMGNNLFRFDLGDIEPGACGSFWVKVMVSCSSVIGQTHCTEAHIYPDTACTQINPLWSGASIEIEADCSDSTRFILKNAGTGPMTIPLEYIVIEDAVMYRYDSGTPLNPGESMEVALPPNGSTWRIEAAQEPLHPQPSQPVAVVEGCGVNPGGSFSLGFVNQFALGDPENFTDTDCTDNIGSFDPNDKSASPTGYQDEHFIAQGTEIEYLVRFQNTGTDTAFSVVIRDTLSQFLDVTSVRPGASSHAYEFEVYGEGILKFTFPDIMLPDSNVNKEASQGFVQFKISPKNNLPVFTEIENSAAIFFDFNEPVITNTTLHTIEKPMVHTALDVTLCAGEAFNGAAFASDTMVVGTFEFALYDSLVWTDIEVLPVFETTLQVAICDGTSYPFNGLNLTQSGAYEALFTATNGCDSTVTLTLAVVDSFEEEISAQICAGESYEFDNQQLTEPGEYVAYYLTSTGCDSVVTLTLNVLEFFETTLAAVICPGQTYLFNGQEISQPGQYEAVFTAANGCDSTVTLFLDLLNVSKISILATICQGETYSFNGDELSQPGQYEVVLVSSFGCDSIVTLTLTVLENFETPVSAAICQGDSYLFNGEELTEPGEYTFTLTALNGCDSIVTLTLASVENFDVELNGEICQGESYEFDNQQLTEPGAYVANYVSTGGCDSTVMLTLAVLEVFEDEISAAICEGEAYIFNGEAITEPGTYTTGFSAANGCDSTVTLQLTVFPTYHDTIAVDVEWGKPYFNDTTIIENLTTVNGCDSMVTLLVLIYTDAKDTYAGTVNLRIFPNPAGRAFFVKLNLKQPEKVSLRVLDVIGREMKFEVPENLWNSGEHMLEIDTGNWPDGVYFVHLQTERGMVTKRVVIAR